MYRHAAESIKETSSRNFISQTEKDKYNNYEIIMRSVEDSYNKEEVDNKIKELSDNTYGNVEGNYISESNTIDGHVKDLEIIGNTVQRQEIINLSIPTSAGAIDGSGEDVFFDNRYRTDFIEVQERDKLSFYYNNESQRMNVFYYDKNKKFINRDGGVSGTESISMSNVIYDAKYVKLYSAISGNIDIRVERTYLEDIKSVGELQEDGTYKMSIVSCGKNLSDLMDCKMNPNPIVADYSLIYCNATNYTVSYDLSVSNNTNPNAYTCVVINRETGVKINSQVINASLFNNKKVYTTIKIPSKGLYEFRITQNNGDVTGVYLANNIQIEEGTVATPYEPYMESRVDINLPCQLEKVGDISDRLYYDEEEKAWCIEKNIGEIVLNGSETWGNNSSQYPMDNFSFFCCEDFQKLLVDTPTNNFNLLCDKFEVYRIFDTQIFKEGIIVSGSENIWIKISKSKLDTQNTTGLKTWLSNNNTTLKHQLVIPQKIILPLSTQIQLNSYANKTHIYTLSGEVEGTIKATLPKSLGSTVQTLNDKTDMMIDRIKNVETLKEGQNLSYESDKGYVLCENTNNGQIDNIKIEGKTLVNLWDINNIKTSGQVVIKENKITATTTTNTYSNFFLQNNSIIKSTTDYTIIVDVYKNTLPSSDTIYITSFNGIDDRDVFSSDYNSQFIIGGGYTGRYVKKYTTVSDTDMINKTLRSFIANRSAVEGSEVELSIMLIEGDHTQTHSSYFEGLMSVGGDVDEIEVMSRKEDENLLVFNKDYNYISNGMTFNIDSKTQVITVNGTCTKDNTTFTVKNNSLNYYNCVGEYSSTIERITDLSGKLSVRFYNDQFSRGVTFDASKLTGGSGSYIQGDHVNFSLRVNSGETINNFKFKVSFYKGKQKDFPVHKSHNKSLLYYNDLGELTPVPELHEWDSIEKHSDGKYYYHKRTHKVILDGSEGWHLNGNLVNGAGYQYVAPLRSLIRYEDINATIVMSDKFKASTSHAVVDCLWIHKGNLVVIHSTLGLEELKKWLQSNNTTFVFKMLNESEEKVYECVNLNLDTYDNETMVMVNSGAISPNLSFNFSSHIGNTVSILRERLKSIEESFTRDKISQNTFQLNTMYSSDKLVFNVNVYSYSITEYDEDLFTLITEVLLSQSYNLTKMEEIIDFYTMIGKLSFDMADILFEIIDDQINPPVIEIPEEEISILPEI